MDTYKKIKFLGEGIVGKVYLVSKNDKKYAMKIDYITGKNDIALKNELHFVEKVASKYPEQFMQLLEHKIIKNCREPTPDLPDWLGKDEKDYFIKLRSSGLCVKKIYNLVNSSLNKLELNKLSICELYSMLIQLLYINYLIQSNGFVHGDFHPGNIGIIKVSKNKKIKIFDKDIPSYGRQFVAIDYGGILHKDTVSNKRKYQQTDKTEEEHYNDFLFVDKKGIIDLMIDVDEFWKYVNKKKLQLNFEDDIKLILSQPEIEFIKSISKNKYILFSLYQMLFTTKWQKLILADTYKKKIPIKCRIKSADILYAYSNFNDDVKLINYFIFRLNENC